jgi:hypothetical protein
MAAKYDGCDAAVMLVAVGRKVEFHEKVGDLFLDRARRDYERLENGGVQAPCTDRSGLPHKFNYRGIPGCPSPPAWGWHFSV